MKFRKTPEICLVTYADANKPDGIGVKDLGNFYETDDGKTVLITTKSLAQKFGHLVNVPIYTRK